MIYTWRSGGQNNSTSNKRLSVSSEFLPLEQVIGSEFQLWQGFVLYVAVVFLLYVVGDVRRGDSHVWPLKSYITSRIVRAFCCSVRTAVAVHVYYVIGITWVRAPPWLCMLRAWVPLKAHEVWCVPFKLRF